MFFFSVDSYQPVRNEALNFGSLPHLYEAQTMLDRVKLTPTPPAPHTVLERKSGVEEWNCRSLRVRNSTTWEEEGA